MKKTIVTKYFIILLSICIILTTTSGVSAKSPSPIQPACSNDPNAPCYAIITHSVQKISSAPSFTMATSDHGWQWYASNCTVAYYSAFNVKVASLTSYFSAAWEVLLGSTYIQAGSVSHSSWTLNSFYSWSNFNDYVHSDYPFAFDGNSHADLYYLGGHWAWPTINQRVTILSEGYFTCSY